MVWLPGGDLYLLICRRRSIVNNFVQRQSIIDEFLYLSTTLNQKPPEFSGGFRVEVAKPG
jgi:hypothetical protein